MSTDMKYIDSISIQASLTTLPSSILKNADGYGHEIDLANATHFELSPVCDGQWTTPDTFYSGDASDVFIRMGVLGAPARLIAHYNLDRSRVAVRDFFKLTKMSVPLWYNGADILVQVANRSELALKIADERFAAEDEELEALMCNVGLTAREEAKVRRALGLTLPS